MRQRFAGIGAGGLTVGLSILLAATWGGAPVKAASPAIQAAKPTAFPLTGTWSIDPLHTNVNFAVRHMGISTVRGRFDEVAGRIVADAEKPENSSVEVTIQAASIDTDVKMRDDHLRTADFFDAATYPAITFKSTRVQKRGGDNWIARGVLTMRGVSREITLPFRLAGPVKDERAGGRIGAEAKLRLNRQDFGIKYNQVLDNGILAVGNDIDIDISAEALPLRAQPGAN